MKAKTKAKTKTKTSPSPRTKAVVKKKEEETALAVKTAIPPYLADKGPAELDIEQGELSLPLIKLLQSNSPAVNADLGHKGHYFNTSSEEDLGDSIVFVPLVLIRKRIMWTPMSEGGGIVCRSFDNKFGNTFGECRNCVDPDSGIARSAWSQEGDPPLCTKYYDFLALILGDVSYDPDSRVVELEGEIELEGHIAVITMSTTKVKAARRIIQVAQAKRVPLYGNVFQMASRFVDTGQFQYYQPEADWVGWVPEDLFAELTEEIDVLKGVAKPEAYEMESPSETVGEEVSDGEGTGEEDEDDLPF